MRMNKTRQLCRSSKMLQIEMEGHEEEVAYWVKPHLEEKNLVVRNVNKFSKYRHNLTCGNII